MFHYIHTPRYPMQRRTALIRHLVLLALLPLACSLTQPSVEELMIAEMDDVKERPMELLGSRANDTKQPDYFEAQMAPGRSDVRRELQRERAMSSGVKTTADYFLRNWLNAQKQSDACLPELGGVERFSSPENPLHSQLAPGGKVFLVGDSVIGQICQLGSPGLCCSSARPCTRAPPFPRSRTSPQEIKLDELSEYKDRGWQHLFQFKLRDGSSATANTAYFVAPEVHDEKETVNRSVRLVTEFIAEKGTTADDVLVLGMIGTHYNHGLTVFQEFVTALIQRVVNPFPGRVVLLGYGPQHFAGAGHYSSSGAKECAPNQLPSDVDMPRNSFRSAIFLRSVWAHLAHSRSRLVDFNQMLSPLWNCHRSAGDCTHWKDPVISLQGQLILNALQKIK
jgi:hypothetical protein